VVVMRDRETFTAMYAREGEPVLHFLARRTFDPAVAADLTAETFALAFRAWPSCVPRSASNCSG
jgi:DNA-directed RNA polymerase specialized sigma24 family protein